MEQRGKGIERGEREKEKERQRGEKGGVKCGFRRRNAVTRRAKIRGGIVSNEKKVGVGI